MYIVNQTGRVCCVSYYTNTLARWLAAVKFKSSKLISEPSIYILAITNTKHPTSDLLKL